jgi:hypothetical protein
MFSWPTATWHCPFPMDEGMHKLLYKDHKDEVAWRQTIPGVDGLDADQMATFMQGQKVRVKHENAIASAMPTPAKRKRFREQRLQEMADTVIKEELVEDAWDSVHEYPEILAKMTREQRREKRHLWASRVKYTEFMRVRNAFLQLSSQSSVMTGRWKEEKAARKKEEEAHEKEVREAAVREAAEAREAAARDWEEAFMVGLE